MKLFSKTAEEAPFPTGAVTVDLAVAVLLSDMVLMDVNDFRRAYKALWKTRMDCTEVPIVRKEFGEFQRLKLESDGRTMFLSLRSGPLPGNMLEMIGRMTDVSAMGHPPAEAQVTAMRNHKAHAVLSCTTYDDKTDPPKTINRAWLIVEILCTLLEHRNEIIGYAPISGQVYRPREWLSSRLKERTINQHDLFMLLCNMRLFPGEQESWVHTLGMEQFCQPDLEVWFKDKDKGGYFFDLLLNASMYSTAESILSLGDTFSLTRDPVSYKLVPARAVPEHKWGKFGAMGLEPISGH